jgi:hypothetical protein
LRIADDSSYGGFEFREGNMSAIAHEACDIFHRLDATLAHIRVSDLESTLIIS